MIEIHLTDQEIQDPNEAIDDPSHSGKTKIKLLVIRMRHEGAKTGFIANNSTTSFTVKVWDLLGAPSDSVFYFIVAGP